MGRGTHFWRKGSIPGLGEELFTTGEERRSPRGYTSVIVVPLQVMPLSLFFFPREGGGIPSDEKSSSWGRILHTRRGGCLGGKKENRTPLIILIYFSLKKEKMLFQNTNKET